MKKPDTTASHAASNSTEMTLRRDYQKYSRRKLLLILLMLIVFAGLFVTGLSFGGASYSIGESWGALTSGITNKDPANVRQSIIWTLRVPRVLMGAVCGCGLGVAGLIMQTILRNPLASPYTLGISAAASFGASLSIVSRTSILLMFIPAAINYDVMIISNSFFFTTLCTFLIYFLSRLRKVTAETILLFGVAMMYVFEAATSFMQFLGNPEELAELVYWMFGSMSKASWSKFYITLIAIVICLLIAYRNAWNFNSLMMGDESAQSSGVHVERLRIIGLLISSFITSVVVSLLGPIGFIGLVAPHIGRMLVGSDHRFLIPVTCLAGSILLIFADTLSNILLAPVILPVGITTSFVGVPLLIYLIMKRRKEHW